jgi:dTDP-4-amino-4,6-dideoxygalactose transaminase
MIEYENLKKLNAPFEDEYRKQFDKVIASGWFVLGQEVESFEAEFGAYCGSPHTIGVANGLDAIHLALRALDLPPGSEVLVPSNTYIATVLAVLQAGLVPVTVEPDLATYNIDPSKMQGRINVKTRAVVVVHLYGKACDMGPILAICRQHGLKLVEDCAQAHGAKYKGQSVGTFGDFGAWSFYPTKNLGALGDSGALTTNNPILAEKVRTLRNYGSKVKYYNEVSGYNSRLDELQAAFLRVKLRHLDAINEHKNSLAKVYLANLPPGLVLPSVHPDFFDVYHIFNVRTSDRDGVRQRLADLGIKTDVHYPVSPNRQAAMKGVLNDPCPISEEIHATTLSLPISFFHTTEEILQVCQAIGSSVKQD